MSRVPPTLRTYSHLEGRRKVPTEYEIATTQLLYYVGRGFEVKVPIERWYQRYQTESPLTGATWEDFTDPRETTYARYTGLHTRSEAHVDGTMRSIEDTDYDARLAPAWVATLARTLPQWRFVCHGLQMIAAYFGHMAPGGRITVAAAFQAADEMRRVHRIAYRMAQLRRQFPTFGDDARQIWQEDAAWQPLRRAIETALVTYDWGESFVALNLCLKPRIDALMLGLLADAARAAGDPLLGQLLFAFEEDAEWHRAWAAELVRVAIVGRAENRDVIDRWIQAWTALGRDAVAAWVQLLPGAGTESASDDVGARIETKVAAWVRGLVEPRR